MEDPRQALSPHSAAAQVLVEGLTDWVALGRVRQYVLDQHPTATPSWIRTETLDVVEWLLAHELVVVGDLEPDFAAWQLDPVSSARRVAELWTDPDDSLLPGDVCWLATTPAGDELAGRLRGGEPSPP